jgi:hypothetical protein
VLGGWWRPIVVEDSGGARRGLENEVAVWSPNLKIDFAA